MTTRSTERRERRPRLRHYDPNGLVIDSADGLSGGTVSEGPGIDLVTAGADSRIGLGGDSILVYHRDLTPVEEFEATAAGFDLALAACDAYDYISMPSCSIGGDHTIPAGVTVSSMPFSRTALTGCLTLGNGAVLNGLELYRVADQAEDLVCIVPPSGDGEMAYVGYCWIVANNGIGAGYAAKGYCNHLTLRSCYVSAQSAGVDSNPFRASEEWPTTVYVATKSAGVFYTQNFAPAGDQPTWTAINDGLSNTDIRSFCLDRSEVPQDVRMFCIDETTHTLWRRTDGSWIAVLTTEEASTALGFTNGESLLSVITDPITGRVYALMGGRPGELAFGILYSDNHGDTWVSQTIVGPGFTYDTSNIDAYNGFVCASRHVWPLGGHRIYISTTHGATWNMIRVSESFSTYAHYLHIHPAAGNVCYENVIVGIGTIYGIIRATSDGYSIKHQGELIGPVGPGAFWCDPEDAGHLVTLAGTDTPFVETYDDWETYSRYGPLSADDITEIAENCSHGKWIFGRDNNGYAVYVSTDIVTLTERSSGMPTGHGGVVGRGLWAVPRERSVAPYTYSCIIPNAAGRALALPEYGDRASWRTDYDNGATHADDWEAGDSHHPAVTLGEGSAEELALDGQELTLAEVLTPTEHMAIGDGSPHHARVHALASESDHSDVENSEKADGRVLVWRAAAGKHVYEDVVGAPAGGNYAAVAGYATSIGNGVDTVYTVTHSLNTWDVMVQIYDTLASPSEQVAATVELASADAITVTFHDVAAEDQYRVLVTAVNVGINNTVAVEEEDGDPSVTAVDTIKFPNGSLTDNGDGSVSVAHHAPVTLSAEAADVLALLDQELDMNVQAANTVLAGPVSGADAAPTFRALNAADIPAHADAHENGGADEISVAGLSGTLADQQTPVDHDHSGDAGDGGTFDAANLTSGAATDGQVLTADGAGGAAWEDATGGGDVASDPIWDAKGDLAVGTGANTASRLAAGTDGHILYADSSQAAGVKWAAPPAGGVVDAADVTYTPAVLTDWDADTDPGDADAALDQLAERVDDLEAGGGGTFTGLTDTPSSYVGHGGKYVAVKATENGLEFL